MNGRVLRVACEASAIMLLALSAPVFVVGYHYLALGLAVLSFMIVAFSGGVGVDELSPRRASKAEAFGKRDSYDYALAAFMADDRDIDEAIAAFEDRLDFIWRMGRYVDIEARTARAHTVRFVRS